MISALPVRTAQSAQLPLTFQAVVGSLRTRATEQSAEGKEILRLMRAARDRVEAYTHQQLMEAEYTLTLQGWWNGEMIFSVVPFGKPSDVKVSYLDSEGNIQDLAMNRFRARKISDKQGVVRLVGTESFPDTDEVTITFKAGYPSANEIPADLIDAMYLFIQERYANRADTPDEKTRTSETLMNPHVWPVIA
ncbi:hypothetical protein BWI93_19130 [Siphonobacter sp. BAB-5385]|uniref:head-tail connector protein n=1 Tax=Siphonobacter sp. BAB-5385 TaxID=1864822 RepID=UPI000B9EA2B9|nr:hypothetical protein [Siphonobacter sp. BAB-5385]OZI06594.1 hypothetical protein BWI93_19130 [Siphonobacter sp. BAB-5385]